MSTDAIPLPYARLVEFCQRWKIRELAVFGSVLRSDFSPESDIDLLVTFDQDAQWSLLDHVQMQNELKTLLGRDVDLVSRRALERSQNPVRREAILESAQTLIAT
jgi:uncharacterized protein